MVDDDVSDDDDCSDHGSAARDDDEDGSGGSAGPSTERVVDDGERSAYLDDTLPSLGRLWNGRLACFKGKAGSPKKAVEMYLRWRGLESPHGNVADLVNELKAAVAAKTPMLARLPNEPSRGGGRDGERHSSTAGGSAEAPGPLHEQVACTAPLCSTIGIQPWVKPGVDMVNPAGGTSRITVDHMVIDKSTGFVLPFGEMGSMEVGEEEAKAMRFEPTTSTSLVVEADCSMGKSNVVFTFLHAMLVANPAFPFVFTSVRCTHANDLYNTISKFKPRHAAPETKTIGQLCPGFLCYRHRENSTQDVSAATQLVISGESITKLGDPLRFAGGLAVWDEWCTHTLIIGAEKGSGHVADTGFLARVYACLCRTVSYRIFAGRDITLTTAPALALQLIAPDFDVHHWQFKSPGQRNALRYAFDNKRDNKAGGGKTLALQRFHLDVIAADESFKSSDEADWSRLWVAISSKKYFERYLQPILQKVLRPEHWVFYYAGTGSEVKDRDFEDTATYLKNTRVIICTTTVEVAINVEVKILRRWLFTYNGGFVSTAAEMMQLIARVPRGSRERQRLMLVYHEIYVLFAGETPARGDFLFDDTKDAHERRGNIRELQSSASAATQSERKDKLAATRYSDAPSVEEVLPFTDVHNQVRAAVQMYKESHRGPKHVVRYFELAAKNGFEPPDVMPPLTNDEEKTLKQQQLGMAYDTDEEKRVNDMGGAMAQIYPWFLEDINARVAALRLQYRHSGHVHQMLVAADAAALRHEIMYLFELGRCYGIATERREAQYASHKALLDVYWSIGKPYRFLVDSSGNPASGTDAADVVLCHAVEAIERATIRVNQKASPDLYGSAKTMGDVRRICNEQRAQLKAEHEQAVGVCVSMNRKPPKPPTYPTVVGEEVIACMLQRDNVKIERLAHVRHLSLDTIRAIEGQKAYDRSGVDPVKHREQKTTTSQLAALVHEVAARIPTSAAVLTMHNWQTSTASPVGRSGETGTGPLAPLIDCANRRKIASVEFDDDAGAPLARVQEASNEAKSDDEAYVSKLQSCVNSASVGVRSLDDPIELLRGVLQRFGMKLDVKRTLLPWRQRDGRPVMLIESVRILEGARSLFDESPSDAIMIRRLGSSERVRADAFQCPHSQRSRPSLPIIARSNDVLYADPDRSPSPEPEEADTPAMPFDPACRVEVYSENGARAALDLLLADDDARRVAIAEAHLWMETMRAEGREGERAFAAVEAIAHRLYRESGLVAVMSAVLALPIAPEWVYNELGLDSKEVPVRFQMVTYEKTGVLSRRYAHAPLLAGNYDRGGRQRKLSYTSMPREARVALGGPFLCDMDMVKAFPSIICSTASRKGRLDEIPLIVEYATNGARLLDAIIEHHGLELPLMPGGCGLSHDDAKDAAKQLCNLVMNDGFYSGWIQKHSIRCNAQASDELTDAVDLGKQAIAFRNAIFDDDEYKWMLAAEYAVLDNLLKVKLRSAKAEERRAETGGPQSESTRKRVEELKVRRRKAETNCKRVKPKLWARWLMAQEDAQLECQERHFHALGGLSEHAVMALVFDGMNPVHEGGATFGELLEAVECAVQEDNDGGRGPRPFFRLLEKPLRHREGRFTANDEKVPPIASHATTEAGIDHLRQLMRTTTPAPEEDDGGGQEEDEDDELAMNAIDEAVAQHVEAEAARAEAETEAEAEAERVLEARAAVGLEQQTAFMSQADINVAEYAARRQHADVGHGADDDQEEASSKGGSSFIDSDDDVREADSGSEMENDDDQEEASSEGDSVNSDDDVREADSGNEMESDDDQIDSADADSGEEADVEAAQPEPEARVLDRGSNKRKRRGTIMVDSSEDDDK